MVKSKKLLAILMAVALILAVVPISALSADGVWDGVMPEANQNAAYSGGSGTQSDPFIIATAEDLAQLSVNAATFSNYSSGKYFLQTDDIVLNPSDVFETDSSGVITGIKEGETANIWTPIGIYISGSNDFGGRYDGGGKAIHGVYIDNTSDYQGLFGRLYVGYIINVRVESSYIKGKDFVGGIVGYNWSGVVSNCSFSGTVIGNSEVGGIIGENNETVTFCRNTGAVSGNSYVGGIVGYNEIYSLVTDSYNTGTVAGSSNAGGLTGFNENVSVVANSYNIGSVSGRSYLGGAVGEGFARNCYYLDTCVDGPSNTLGATALTDAQMQSAESFDIDFLNIWVIQTSTGYPYPQHMKNLPPALGGASALWNGSIAPGFDGGTGTEADPYRIRTADQLAYLASSVNSGTTYEGQYFVLENDIMLNDNTADNWVRNATPWTPIGTEANPFKGSFDGGGHVISGVFIDSISNDLGLFGYIFSGSVADLGIAASYVNGRNNVGALAGSVKDGTITNCYNTSTVSGDLQVGGLVGYYYSGNVSDCYNTGAVSGSTTLGGILGLIINGPISGCFNTGSISGIGASGGVAGGCGSSCTITDCYNTGSIVCIFNCGGIAGLAGNPISNCYNIGTVEGKLYFGGLVGTDNSGAVTNSYYLDTCVVNPTETDGTALTDSAMKLEESYVGFDFENTWSINPLASYPYPTLSDLTPVTPETPVAGVSLNKSVLDLFAGDSEVLIATIEPADATNTAVFWSSSDDSVATVNQSGLVTGIAEGTAIITVTTEDGSFTASCEVNVERREAPEEPEEDDSCWARFLSCLRRIFNFIKSLFNIYH